VKRQKVSDQLERNKEYGMQLVDVKNNQGVKGIKYE
jgi:hypothetical protein